MLEHVDLVDVVKNFRTRIYLQNLASIQPRTSRPKFADTNQPPAPGSQLPLCRLQMHNHVLHVPDVLDFLDLELASSSFERKRLHGEGGGESFFKPTYISKVHIYFFRTCLLFEKFVDKSQNSSRTPVWRRAGAISHAPPTRLACRRLRPARSPRPAGRTAAPHRRPPPGRGKETSTCSHPEENSFPSCECPRFLLLFIYLFIRCRGALADLGARLQVTPQGLFTAILL